MPEIGDKALVHFGDPWEPPLVMACLRRDGAENPALADPATKILGNTHGKELMLAEEGIRLKATGEKGTALTVKLSEEGGVIIESDGELNLASDETIRLNAGNNLSLKAGHGIYLSCGTSSVILDGSTDIQGLKVIFNGDPVSATEGEAAATAEETAPEAKKGESLSTLDLIQGGLDALGFIPVWGAVFDVANAGISAARGNWAEAGLSLLAAVPGVGDAAAVLKLSNRAAKTVKAVTKTAIATKSISENFATAYKQAKEGNWTDAAIDLGISVGIASFGKVMTKARRLQSTNGFAANIQRIKEKMAKRSQRKIRKFQGKKLRNSKTSKAEPGRAEPVDAVTGEVFLNQDDFVISGRVPLEWRRHYSSQTNRVGACGLGWESPADMRLEFQADGMVAFYDGSAAPTYFEKRPQYSPVLDKLTGSRLMRDEAGLYSVRTKDDVIYRFVSLGTEAPKELPVQSIRDLFGNGWEFQRDREGNLTGIADPSGRTIRVYRQQGRIIALSLTAAYHTSRKLVRYDYDEATSSLLTAAYDALDAPHRYDYRNRILTRHTNRTGFSFYYEYDRYSHEGRCRHTWGDGGLYDYRFEYDVAARRTHITDSLGHSSAVEYDESQMIVAEIDALGGVTRYEYDEANRPSAVIDQEGRRMTTAMTAGATCWNSSGPTASGL